MLTTAEKQCFKRLLPNRKGKLQDVYQELCVEGGSKLWLLLRGAASYKSLGILYKKNIFLRHANILSNARTIPQNNQQLTHSSRHSI